MTDRPEPDDDAEALPVLPTATWSARPATAAFESDDADESGRAAPEPAAVVKPRPPRSRDGKAASVVGRVFKVTFFLVILVALLATVGRSLVFPQQWTAEVAPFVDELQTQYAMEFAESLDVVELPASAYATRVAASVLGPGWADRLPEWRALGLVGGRVSVETVEGVVATRYPAHYDPVDRSIVVSRAVEPADRAVALQLAVRVALAAETAEERPTGPLLGLTGIDRLDRLAWWSIDEGFAGPGFEYFDDPEIVPLPVGYLMRAPARLGRSLTGGARLLAPGTPPPAVAARLDDGAEMSVEPAPAPGDRILLDPVSLGADDWTMIWGARLEPGLAAQMADVLAADSYSVVEREDRSCVVAIIEGADANGTEVLAAGLTVWVDSAPPTTAGLVRLDEVRLRLESCDPGIVALPPSLTAVEVVIGRQLARLAN